MHRGYIKTHRKIRDWKWWSEPLTAYFFLNLILMANHKDRYVGGTKVKRGQLLAGREYLAKETFMSEKQVRIRLGRLQKSEEISILSTHKGSLITINNYNTYQAEASNDSSQKIKNKKGQPFTNHRPNQGHKRAINNNDNELLNDKKNILINSLKSIYTAEFPNATDLESFTNNFESLKQNIIKKIKSSNEKEICEYFTKFLRTLPKFYKEKAFAPTTLDKNFPTIILLAEGSKQEHEIDLENIDYSV